MFIWHGILFCLLITFTISWAFHSNPPIAAISSRQTVNEPGWVRFNNYNLVFCGDPRNATSYASTLMHLLTVMKPQLERLAADAQLGTHSSRYTAFFKSNRNVHKLINQLRNLIDVNPVIVDASRAKTAGSWTPEPKLICITETNPHTAAWMDECRKRPNEPAFLWLGTEAVAICPMFWALPLFPTHCPLLEGGTFGREDNYVLLNDMYAFMVVQLVRMYDRGIRESEMNHGIAGTMLKAMELDMRQSLLSATNYGFYAGGKFGDIFSLWLWMSFKSLI